jgi:hypothetical protein
MYSFIYRKFGLTHLNLHISPNVADIMNEGKT